MRGIEAIFTPGQRLGKAVVIGRAVTPKRGRHYLFRCDCSKEFSRCGSDARRVGDKNHCGCSRKKRERKIPPHLWRNFVERVEKVCKVCRKSFSTTKKWKRVTCGAAECRKVFKSKFEYKKAAYCHGCCQTKLIRRNAIYCSHKCRAKVVSENWHATKGYVGKYRERAKARRLIVQLVERVTGTKQIVRRKPRRQENKSAEYQVRSVLRKVARMERLLKAAAIMGVIR